MRLPTNTEVFKLPLKAKVALSTKSVFRVENIMRQFLKKIKSFGNYIEIINEALELPLWHAEK